MNLHHRQQQILLGYGHSGNRRSSRIPKYRANTFGFYSVNGNSVVRFRDHSRTENIIQFLKSIRESNPEKPIMVIKDIPNFRTLSYRSLRIDWHYINSSIIDMINLYNGKCCTRFISCKDLQGYNSTQRGRKNGKYKDPESSWGYSTMGYEYGRKIHASIDIDLVCPINNLDSYEKEYINIVEYYYSINRGAL